MDSNDKLGLALMTRDISQRGRMEKILKTIYTYGFNRSVPPKTGVITDRCSHFATGAEVRSCLNFMVENGYLNAEVCGKAVRYSITEIGIKRLWDMIKSIDGDNEE